MFDSIVMFKGTIYGEGYGLIARQVMRDKDLKPASKAIYAYICSFASNGNSAERVAFPSVDLQLAELQMTQDTYYKHRKKLIEKGYLQIEKKPSKNGKFENNLYIICPIPIPIKIEKPIPEKLGYGENVDLEPFSPHPKNSGMAEKPHPKFSDTVKSSTENSGTKTKSLKSNSSKSNNSPSLTTTSSSLAPFEILDVKLKNKYPNHPFDEIKAKMLEEAENGKCTVSTAKQYSSLLEYRLKNYVEPKPSETAQIRTKTAIRTEYIPDYMKDEFEPNKKPWDEDELERKKMILGLKLKFSRQEITKEELEIGLATLE